MSNAEPIAAAAITRIPTRQFYDEGHRTIYADGAIVGSTSASSLQLMFYVEHLKMDDELIVEISGGQMKDVYTEDRELVALRKVQTSVVMPLGTALALAKTINERLVAMGVTLEAYNVGSPDPVQ